MLNIDAAGVPLLCACSVDASGHVDDGEILSSGNRRMWQVKGTSSEVEINHYVTDLKIRLRVRKCGIKYGWECINIPPLLGPLGYYV